MKRIIRAAAVTLGLGALAACAEDTPEIYILSNQAMTDTCEVPTGGTSFRSRGTLDLFIADQYIAIPRVENTLVASETAGFSVGTGGGTAGLEGTDWEANNINLDRAEIRFDAPAALSTGLPNRIDVDISGGIPPQSDATVSIQAINPSIARTLAGSSLLTDTNTSVTIKLRIKFYGTTMTGREVDSNEFVYPVELCYGCLVAFPSEANDDSYPVQPNCRAGYPEDTAAPELCMPGQDEFVDCREICPRATANNADPFGVCEPTF